MKSIVVTLLLLISACATTQPPAPPVPVEVKVAVPVPCQIAEPECSVPAYDQATKEMPMDNKVKLMRVEAIEQGECLRKYRDALAVCRASSPQ